MELLLSRYLHISKLPAEASQPLFLSSGGVCRDRSSKGLMFFSYASPSVDDKQFAHISSWQELASPSEQVQPEEAK